MFLTSSMALVMSWTDVIMLGIYSNEAEVGIYSVAVKLANLTSIVLIAVNSIAAPKFVEFYSKGDIEGFIAIVQNSTKIIFFSSLPIILFLFLFSKYILILFGQKFVDGYIALWILLIGQTVNTISGPVGYILMMIGEEKVFRNITIITSFINITLNYLLVQRFGINGVAFATAISLSLLNIISLIYIKTKLGFWTLNFRRIV